MRSIEHWIDGALKPSSGSVTSSVYNPATGQQQAQVVIGSSADVDAAGAHGRAVMIVAELPEFRKPVSCCAPCPPRIAPIFLAWRCRHVKSNKFEKKLDMKI